MSRRNGELFPQLEIGLTALIKSFKARDVYNEFQLENDEGECELSLRTWEFTRIQLGVFQFRAEMFVRRADKIRYKRTLVRSSLSASISKYRKSRRVA